MTNAGVRTSVSPVYFCSCVEKLHGTLHVGKKKKDSERAAVTKAAHWSLL